MNAETRSPKAAGEERRAPAPPNPVPEAATLHAVRPPDADSLSLMREEFERLKNEYGLGLYKKVKADTLKFISKLESCINWRSALRDDLRAHLLHAEALTLLGRAYERVDTELAARSAWSKAARMFEHWLPEGHSRCVPALGYPDYGIALYKMGRKGEALQVLKDFQTGESGRYLGICLMDFGRYQEAEAIFRELLREDPHHPFTHKSLGKSLEAQGRTGEAVTEYHKAAYYMASLNIFDEALNTLDRALSLKPDDTGLLSLKGAVLSLLKRYPEALEVFRRSLALSPDESFTLMSMGQVLRTIGDYEDAARALTRAIELDPSLGWAYLELGTVRYEQEQYEPALDALDRALALLPNEVMCLLLRGKVLKGLGRNEEAVESLRRATGAHPTLREPYTELARALVDLGRHGEALRLLDAAREKVPGLAVVLSMLRSQVLVSADDEEGALRTLEESLAGDPGGPYYAFLLALKGRVLHSMRRDEEAVLVLREALERGPETGWAYGELAEALIYLGRTEEAWQTEDRALELSPHNASALEVKGRLLRAEHKPTEAIEVLRRALEIDGARGGAAAELAFAERDYEAALAAAEEALALRSDDVWSLGLKGGSLRGLGLEEEAIKTLRRAIGLNGKLPWLHVELGQALYAVGQYQKALEAFDAALALQPDHANALASKGEVLRVLNQPEEALKVLDQALTFTPRDAWMLGTKGQVLADLKRYEHAIPILQRALELNPNLAWVYATLSVTHYSWDSNYPEMLAAMKKALDLEFNHAWAIFTAHVRCDIGDYAVAVEILDRVLASDGANTDALGLKGWALQSLGRERAPEMLRTYETVIGLRPEDLWMRTGYADALYLNGLWEDSA